MRFNTVETLNHINSDENYYTLGIFASGFEERATFVARQTEKKSLENCLILGFSGSSETLSRKENDFYFTTEFGTKITLLQDQAHDSDIFKILDKASEKCHDAIFRVLVDYSVMTRTWYAAILTWARFATDFSGIEIDFVYAAGTYLSDFDPLSISEIECLPGFEGVSGGFRSTTAIFGLGYDRYATLAVYDRLEPDAIYCCIARKSADDPSAVKVLSENEVVVEAASKVISLPLTNVSEAFRILCDHVIGLERDSHIVVVPMGPKSHVLVTLLVALRLPWLTCLHARGQRTRPVQVVATGVLSISKVSFVPM